MMKDRLIGLFLCALFGFIGGATSNLMLNTRTVAAQQPSTVLRAQHFQIINKHGKVVGELGVNDLSNTTELKLRYDPKGKVLSILDSDGLSIGHESESLDMYFGLAHSDMADFQPGTGNPSIWVRDRQGKVKVLVGQ